jgi:hypothetical protein
MGYDEARVRNALPEPPDQYGAPGPGGVYDHFDEVALDRPVGAVRVEVDLLYQPTSWEYIQFLQLANDGTSAFLGEEGDRILEAWLHTGMAAPYAIASAATPLPEPGEALSLVLAVAFLAALGHRRARRAARSEARGQGDFDRAIGSAWSAGPEPAGGPGFRRRLASRLRATRRRRCGALPSSPWQRWPSFSRRRPARSSAGRSTATSTRTSGCSTSRGTARDSAAPARS